jgi:hypothetical protein
VKTSDFSKSAIIRYESELVHHFKQLLEDDAELAWQSSSGDSAQGRLPWVELKLDAQAHRFKPVYSLKPERGQSGVFTPERGQSGVFTPTPNF